MNLQNSYKSKYKENNDAIYVPVYNTNTSCQQEKFIRFLIKNDLAVRNRGFEQALA